MCRVFKGFVPKLIQNNTRWAVSNFQEWWQWRQFHDSSDVAGPWRSAWWERWCGFYYKSDFRWMWRKHSIRMASHSLPFFNNCSVQNVHWNATWKNWALRLLISLARKTSSLQRCVVHKIQFCLREGREHDMLKLLQFSQDGWIFSVHWEWFKEPIRMLQGSQWG